jgi:hypothetical protein
MTIVTTPIELYRAGNKTSPRFDYLRPGEIAIESRNGVDWVLGPGQGGASTEGAITALQGTWYRLPQGTTYDDAVLYLWNDYATHWSWEPAQDMQLDTYRAALTALNSEFIRV